MATVHQLHLADMAAILADPDGPADVVIIGAVSLRCVRDLPALVAADSEGLLIERQSLVLLASALGFQPVTGQELVVDDARWLVESCPPGDVLDLNLMRYRS